MVNCNHRNPGLGFRHIFKKVTMNQTIINTCGAIADKITLIDIAAEIVKTQWKELLVAFIIVPLIFVFITILFFKEMKVKTAKFIIFLLFMFIALISLIVYLILISGDFSFLSQLVAR